MLTNGMHAAFCFQTIFGTVDAIGFWLTQNYELSTLNATRAIIGVGIWTYGWLKHRHDIGFVSQLVCAWFFIAVQAAFHGGVLSSYIFWVTIFGPIIVMTGGRKVGLTVSSASIIWILALSWLGSNGHIKVYSTEPSVMAYSIVAAMVVFYVMCQVVTNYQQSALASLDREFERSTTLEANKSKFLVHVNHEIRNPLSALLLSVDLLKDASNRDSTDQKHILHSIDVTSHHILEILNGVLQMEREDHIHAKEADSEFDPVDVVKESISILEAKAITRGVTLEISPEVGIKRHLHGNKVKLRQVLINLMSNSIQHGGSKTTVQIRHSGGELTYVISDNGPGMSKQALDNLFTVYSSSLGAVGTTGLGLHICKNLVEITMGGSLSVKSNGTGTTFTVNVPFPISTGKPPSKSAKKAIRPENVELSQSLEGKSILIVEDDHLNNEMVSKLLTNSKMCTTSAMDSSQALSQVQALGPFDFALVDSDLGCGSPLNGIELTKLIAGQTIVIGFTGNHSRDLDRKWREAGASNILHKPVGIDGILTALRATEPESLRASPKKTPHNDKLTKASP